MFHFKLQGKIAHSSNSEGTGICATLASKAITDLSCVAGRIVFACVLTRVRGTDLHAFSVLLALNNNPAGYVGYERLPFMEKADHYSCGLTKKETEWPVFHA